jgi:hypothetical protein
MKTLAEMMAESESSASPPAPVAGYKTLAEITAESARPKRETPQWIKDTLAEPEIGEDRSSVAIRPEGRWSARDMRWESTKPPIKAVWEGPGVSPLTPTSTATDLESAARPDTMTAGRAALAGGALQGVTLGHADELAAAASAIGGEDYEIAQRGNRQAFADSKQGDPKAFATGKLAGEAALLAANPGGMVAGPGRLLTAGNLGRGALVGGLAAMGETEAGGGQAAIDVAKGAGFGLGATAAMGALGATGRKIANYVRTAPERAAVKENSELLDLLSLGAPKSMRDELVGKLGKDAPEILAMVKAHPAWESVLKRGDHAAAAEMVMAAQRAHAERFGRVIEHLGKRTRGEVEPLVQRLSERRDTLAAVPAPEAQAEAAKVQNIIQTVSDRWLPPKKSPTPQDGELVGKLLAKADTGEKERAGLYAADFAATAKKYGLHKVADNIPARTKVLDKATSRLEDAKDAIYSVPKQGVYIANVTGKLREWADGLRKQWGRSADADMVEAEIASIWKEAKAGGNELTGARTQITPKELRKQITSLQDNAFIGKYLDTSKQKSMQREIVGKLREVLDEHVERFGGPELVKKLHEVNREYSAIIAFKQSAQKELAAANLAPVPTPKAGTGQVTPADFYKLAQTIKDPETRAIVMGEMYRQIGGPATRLVAKQERKGELLGRLEEPLSYLAQRNATSPTTLRAGVNSITEGVQRVGTTGAMAGGAAATVLGGGSVGIPVMVASIAAKYGKPVADAAERAAVKMELAMRRGAKVGALNTIARAARLPQDVAMELIKGLTPMEAGAREPKKEDR